MLRNVTAHSLGSYDATIIVSVSFPPRYSSHAYPAISIFTFHSSSMTSGSPTDLLMTLVISVTACLVGCASACIVRLHSMKIITAIQIPVYHLIAVSLVRRSFQEDDCWTHQTFFALNVIGGELTRS